MSDIEEMIEFLRRNIEDETNELIRQEEDVKGVIKIEVKTSGTYDVKVHKGTGSEATSIEDIGKNKLIKLIEDNA